MARKKPVEDETIVQLTQFQHCRIRTSMYLGSTVTEKLRFPVIGESNSIKFQEFNYVPAILVSFREAIDNSLDELTKCGGGNLRVEYDEKTLIFKVSDDGRGIPIDYSDELGTYKATAALSETRTGRNFMEREGTAGMNGLGISVVNMCSEWFQTYIERDGKSFFQRFDPGETDLVISTPVMGKSKNHGTCIEFKLSKEIFDGTLPTEIVKSLLYQISISQPKINIFFNDKKITHKIDPKLAIFGKTDSVHEVNIDGDASIRIFIAPSEDGFEHFSLVNNIPTVNGGSHVDSLKYKFGNRVLEYLKKESRKRKLNPNKQDVLSCCFFYTTIFMNAPEFDSQTKSRLLNKDISTQIHSFLGGNDLSPFKLPKKIVEMIYERCSARTGRKDKAEIDAKAKQLKKKKIPSLSDATSKDRKKCTLAVFEGFSASASYLSVRDVETQASMPLRGKIRNTWGLRPKSALKSETIDQICAAIGIVPGKAVNTDDLRYSQIQIYTDADHDGCFVGDTEVHTLKYGSVRFDELVEKFGDESFWVWSRDSNLRQVPALAHSPRITKKVDKMCRVTLDDGKEIECTLNHRFMLSDGSWCEAKDLLEKSVMPFRHFIGKSHRTPWGSVDKQILDEEAGFIPEHILSASRNQNEEWIERNSLKEGIRYDVHHKDSNHSNNSPDNLEILTELDHWNLTVNDWNKSGEKKELNSRNWADGKYQSTVEGLINYNKSEKNRESTRIMNRNPDIISVQLRGRKLNAVAKCVAARYEPTALNIDKFRSPSITVNEYEICKLMNDPSFEKRVEHFSGFNIDDLKRVVQIRNRNPQTSIFVNNCKKLIGNDIEITHESYEDVRGKRSKKFDNILAELQIRQDEIHEFIEMWNHKVIKVEFVRVEPTEVWDLTVPDTHNFALSNGCYVHNSNITGLVIALFYNFWPELFDRDWLNENNNGIPFIAISLTPLFAIQKGKERKYFYVRDKFDMDDWKKKGWKFVSRFKGLGALDNEEWVAHVNDKESKIPVFDDGKLEAVLNTNFGDRSSLRKKMLQGELTIENVNDFDEDQSGDDDDED